MGQKRICRGPNNPFSPDPALVVDMRTSKQLLQIDKNSKILVRANNWIGDVVLMTPALHSLRTAFPEASITVLAKPWVIPVLKNNSDINNILLYDDQSLHSGLRGTIRLASQLRGQGFHCAILFQRAFEAALLSFLARIPNRAGFTTDARGFLLTHKARPKKRDFSVHRVEHNQRLLAGLGLAPISTNPALPLSQESIRQAKQRLADLGVPANAFLFGLNPGATFGGAKRWPVARFAALSDQIVQAFGAKGIIFGGSSEKVLGDQVIKQLGGKDIFNLAGETSLSEAIALIGLCGLFITNDSGLMHIAAALDIPLVAIFGPTDYRTTSPWSNKYKLVRKTDLSCSPCMKRECPLDHHQCMEAITAQEVFDSVQRLLDQHPLNNVASRMETLKISERSVPVRTFD